MKKKNFFFPDFFNFSEICVIFAQICIFWPFSFFKRVLKGVEKYMAGKKFVKNWPMNICFSLSAHKILEPQTQISRKKSKFVFLIKI